MRKLAFVAGALALVSMSGVAAADGSRGGPVYAPAAYNWSGVYFGAHIGGGWGDVDIRETSSLTIGGGVPLVQSHDTSGWLGGVQLGAMKQFGTLVVGASLRGVFEFWQEWLVGSVTNLMLFDLRNLFFRSLIHLDVDQFGEQGSGELMSRFTNDMESLGLGIKTLFG